MNKFNFSLIENQFNEVLSETENRIQNSWSSKFPNLGNGRLLTLNYFQLAKIYYKTIDLLCDDRNNLLTLTLSVPPLVRSILEILYVLIYFFDDVPEKTQLFSITMYREQKRVLNIWEEKYSGTPEWDKKIQETKDFLVQTKFYFKDDFGQSAFDSVDWESNKNSLPKFSKMRDNFETKNPQLFKFLKFLDDMWYRELSMFAHPEPFGLAQIRPILMQNNTDELKYFKNENLWLSLTLIMCISSEIEITLNLELQQNLNVIWQHLAENSSISKEIYEMRYQKLLNE